MNSIKHFLTSRFFQRICYFVLLLIDIYSISNNFENLWLNSSYGIPYIYLYIIPLVILLYQIVFNNRIGWWLLFTFYIIFSILGIIISVRRVLADLDVKYNIVDVFEVILILFVTYLIMGVCLYFIKPR